MVIESACEASGRVRETQGRASLRFSRVGERTVVTEVRATSPLRVLTPRMAGSRAAWAFTSTFGGGLLEGDRVEMDVEAEAGTECYLGTQSSTKVYRSAGGGTARQTLRAVVGAEAVLVVTPDPVVCFRDARYMQRQRFEVAASGSLVLLDWFTSGRHACGERWQFHALSSRNEVNVGGRRLVTDALLLDERAGPLAGHARTGGLDCYATLVVCGLRVEGAARAMLEEIGGTRLRKGETLRVAGSGICGGGGAIVRVAARNVEEASAELYRHLGFLRELLGEHPWLRKW